MTDISPIGRTHTEAVAERMKNPEYREERWRMKSDELLYEAWSVIANAGGGDWQNELGDWVQAATKWRDRYHSLLAEQRQFPKSTP